VHTFSFVMTAPRTHYLGYQHNHGRRAIGSRFKFTVLLPPESREPEINKRKPDVFLPSRVLTYRRDIESPNSPIRSPHPRYRNADLKPAPLALSAA